MFIYFERERESAQMGEGQREKERQRIPSRFCAVSTEPDVGLEPTNHEITTWIETKSWTLNQLSHPGTPRHIFFKLFQKCEWYYKYLWKYRVKERERERERKWKYRVNIISLSTCYSTPLKYIWNVLPSSPSPFSSKFRCILWDSLDKLPPPGSPPILQQSNLAALLCLL